MKMFRYSDRSSYHRIEMTEEQVRKYVDHEIVEAIHRVEMLKLMRDTPIRDLAEYLEGLEELSISEE
jgi:hypothetical protein